MPGMMRSRKSGCMCLDCDGPRITDRASEKRDWKRREWAQMDPCADDESIQFGYWSAIQDDDWFLNEQARPYLTRTES